MSDDAIDRKVLEQIEREATERLKNACDLEALEELRINYLGRKGVLTLALRSIGQLPQEERPLIGSLINEIKGRFNSLFDEIKAGITSGISDEEPYPGDPSLPGRRMWTGGPHLLHKVTKDVKEIFYRMGRFIIVFSTIHIDP